MVDNRMRLQGPNFDARRVYQIRNAQIHAHENGRIIHITSGEVFMGAEPMVVHHATLVCTDHWSIWEAAENHPDDDGSPSHYGFDHGEDCNDDCPTRWFYDVTDEAPVTSDMPKI